jgi:hypothetical protein
MKKNSIHISDENLKDIADYLDAGMLCFYHIPTETVDYFPDPLRTVVYDEENWEDVMNKIENNREEYIRFEGMEGRESFQLMEDFIAEIPGVGLRAKFVAAIENKKPFQGFKSLLAYYPDLREKWFEFKAQKYLEFVKDQLDGYQA